LSTHVCKTIGLEVNFFNFPSIFRQIIYIPVIPAQARTSYGAECVASKRLEHVALPRSTSRRIHGMGGPPLNDATRRSMSEKKKPAEFDEEGFLGRSISNYAKKTRLGRSRTHGSFQDPLVLDFAWSQGRVFFTSEKDKHLEEARDPARKIWKRIFSWSELGNDFILLSVRPDRSDERSEIRNR